MASIGALVVDGNGQTWQALLRRVEVNRGSDPRNTVSTRKQKLVNLEVSQTHYFDRSTLSVGLARDDGEYSDNGSTFTDTRLYLQWQWRAR
jgi:hypothetical protein